MCADATKQRNPGPYVFRIGTGDLNPDKLSQQVNTLVGDPLKCGWSQRMRRNGKLSLAAMIGDGRTRLRCRQARRAIGGLPACRIYRGWNDSPQLLVFPALHE
jgi:hypothetical protein